MADFDDVKGLSDSVDQTTKSVSLLDRTIERAKGTVREYAREISLTGDYYEQMAKRGTWALDQWKDKIYEVSKAGKTANVKLVMSMKNLLVSFQETTKKAEEQKQAVANLSKEYAISRDRLDTVIKRYKAFETQLVANRSQQQALTMAMQKDSKLKEKNTAEIAELIEKEKYLAEDLENVKEALKLTTQETEDYENALHRATIEANKLDESMNKQYDSLRDNYRALQNIQIDQAKAAGGFKALGASMKGLVVNSETMWGYLDKFFKGGMFLIGLKKLGDALTQWNSYLVADRTAAMQLGDAVGKKGMVQQFSDANTALRESTRLAGELGMKVDEVQVTANKFRLGTILDRNGRLGEQTLQNLTREAAYFSKVAGIDASEAAEMLDYRIKTLGLSADDAIADMQGMRATINQMMLANKNANVPMRDMVNIINDASKESGSYVVDTRILTMALQGAANAAANLGASSRQAADVAKGVGAVLTKTPEYIKLPTGYNLVNELMGEDPEKFLSRFDEATRKQLSAIREDLKAHRTNAYMASKAIMDIAGSSDYVMSKQFERTKRILLGGQKGGLLLAKEFGITNAATAENVARSLNEIAEYQELFAEGSSDALLSMSVNMAMNAGKFDETVRDLNTQQEKIEKLKELGFDEKDAENYLKVMEKQGNKKRELIDKLKTMTKGTKEYEKTLQELKDLRDEYNLATERADPLGKTRQILSKLKDMPELTVETRVAMDAGDLGNKFDDFAKSFGITEKGTIEKMRKQAEKQKGLSAKEINSYVMLNNKFIEDQRKNFDNWATRFSSGPVEAIKATLEKFVPMLNSPIGKIVQALAAWGAVLLGTRFFLNRFVRGVLGGTITTSSYKGTYRGVSEAIGRSGGLGGLGGGDSGGPAMGGQRRLKRFKKMGWARRMGRGAKGLAWSTVGRGKLGRMLLRPGRTIGRAAGAAAGAMGTTGRVLGVGAKTTGRAGAIAAKGGFKFGAMAFKTLKASKALPFAGTIIGGGFALMQAWEIYRKWKAGEKISNSDKARMVTELASMIPGIGTAIVAGDIVAESTGLYDQLDKLGKKPEKPYKPLPAATTMAQTLVGTPVPAAAFVGSLVPTIMPTTAGVAGAGAAVGMPKGGASAAGVTAPTMEPVAGQTYSGDDIIVRFKNFAPMIAQMNKNAKSLAFGAIGV